MEGRQVAEDCLATSTYADGSGTRNLLNECTEAVALQHLWLSSSILGVVTIWELKAK